MSQVNDPCIAVFMDMDREVHGLAWYRVEQHAVQIKTDLKISHRAQGFPFALYVRAL